LTSPTTSDNCIHTSVIVPVYNSACTLGECLDALKASGCVNTEIIAVDDASTDDSPLIAAQAGVKVLRLVNNSGPAAARNFGARHARGEILFFVDADVVIAPGAVKRVRCAFLKHPDLAAVFGSYDAQPRAAGMVSQYRNLMHHFVHQNGDSEASTFWAGCGAVRRSVFEQLGGFDEKRFPRPSIEDIELGYRLRRSGFRIRLEKSLQGTHLKQWTLYSLLKTDIFARALPWSELILDTQVAPNDLNIRWDQRASFVLLMLACTFLLLGLLSSEFIVISAAVLLAVLVLNRRIYLFFFRHRGLPFTLGCIPLHILYYLYSGFSYLYVRAVCLLRGIATL
jgi:glycosyltransferase involved in cell wall biosynthesis